MNRRNEMNSETCSNHQSDWETCVVCGGDVAPGRGAARVNHRGDTINVCGPACLQVFAQEPDPYLARLAKKMREQVLRATCALERLEAGTDGDYRPVPSFQIMGTKRPPTVPIAGARAAG